MLEEDIQCFPNNVLKNSPRPLSVSQVFPQRAGERPPEPPSPAAPGAAGAPGGEVLHPEGLSERTPLAQPLRPGAHQPAERAVGEPHHRHHHHEAEEPSEGV